MQPASSSTAAAQSQPVPATVSAATQTALSIGTSGTAAVVEAEAPRIAQYAPYIYPPPSRARADWEIQRAGELPLSYPDPGKKIGDPTRLKSEEALTSGFIREFESGAIELEIFDRSDYKDVSSFYQIKAADRALVAHCFNCSPAELHQRLATIGPTIESAIRLVGILCPEISLAYRREFT